MLTLTDGAVKKVKELFDADATLKGKFLRVYVEPGHGCSQYQYGFGFDDRRDGDTDVPLTDFTVVVDAQSAALLGGCSIDYREDFSGGGFAITNPNAKKSCGCGKSFDA
jgi:iron-sulfur cluster assembly protein/iron-sulfur cluster insertion protein